MTLSTTDPRAFLTSLFEGAVAVADPMRVVGAHLPPRPQGRLVVVGAGKASARMAEAVEAHYGPCEGIVITRYGYARACAGIEIVEAAHPVPDEAGQEATLRMLDLLAGVGADDLVIALISGGGSALLCAPREGATLEDKIGLNAQLLASGAPIGVMNTVRKHLSRVKGGQLAAAAHPASVLALAISDVPGDDPGLIASGPTVSEASTPQEAAALLATSGVIPEPAVASALGGPSRVIPPGDPRLVGAETQVIAAPSHSLAAAKALAEAAGCDVQVLGHDLEGEARDLAVAHARLAQTLQAELSAHSAPLLLLSGGECTVTRRGDGVGGPNAEYVLSAALQLNGAPGIHVLACDTDGVDGAAEVAGAYAGPATLVGSRDSAERALANNDAHSFFAGINSQIVTGPTLTNVNDFRAILIAPRGRP